MNHDAQAAKLPQAEGADWFMVMDPGEGLVYHTYGADLGRSFGHEHIKYAQAQGDETAFRWVVRPAYRSQSSTKFELTTSVKDILGTMCFHCAHFAVMLRKDGHQISHRAEDEQAHALFWMLCQYFAHGDDWRSHAMAEIQRIEDASKESQKGGA